MFLTDFKIDIHKLWRRGRDHDFSYVTRLLSIGDTPYHLLVKFVNFQKSWNIYLHMYRLILNADFEVRNFLYTPWGISNGYLKTTTLFGHAQNYFI